MLHKRGQRSTTSCNIQKCCEMLGRKIDHFQTWSNVIQHVATGWPDGCNMLYATMLGYLRWNVAYVWPGLKGALASTFHQFNKPEFLKFQFLSEFFYIKFSHNTVFYLCYIFTLSIMLEYYFSAEKMNVLTHKFLSPYSYLCFVILIITSFMFSFIQPIFTNI